MLSRAVNCAPFVAYQSIGERNYVFVVVVQLTITAAAVATINCHAPSLLCQQIEGLLVTLTLNLFVFIFTFIKL